MGVGIMSFLTVTLIDVGWGDSILIESESRDGQRIFGLIDSNDDNFERTSYYYLKRHFDKLDIDVERERPIFEFVIMSHHHSDHAQGLKRIMRYFGTRKFWYPKSAIDRIGSTAEAVVYARRSASHPNKRVGSHEAIDSDKELPDFGRVKLEVLWPPYGRIDRNENNNSIVLAMTLGGRTFLLTGDAERYVWDQISTKIPNGTRFFKIPHHGSIDSTDAGHRADWLDQLRGSTRLGISSHVRPHRHPHPAVVRLLDQSGQKYYRTDQHYHVRFHTDGSRRAVRVEYFH